MKWTKIYADLPKNSDRPYIDWGLDFIWSANKSNYLTYEGRGYNVLTDERLPSVVMEIADILLNDPDEFLRFFKAPVHWLAIWTDFPRAHNPMSNEHFRRILSDVVGELNSNIDGEVAFAMAE